MVDTLRSKFAGLRPVLDERARRLWAATEACAIGRGGIARVAEATGMSRGTVRAGLKELASGVVAEASGEAPSGRLRRPGGGRKRVTELDPDLVVALERHLEPVTRGDPESPLRWTCNSAAHLADRLTAEGHPVSERTVNRQDHAQHRRDAVLAPQRAPVVGKLRKVLVYRAQLLRRPAALLRLQLPRRRKQRTVPQTATGVTAQRKHIKILHLPVPERPLARA